MHSIFEEAESLRCKFSTRMKLLDEQEKIQAPVCSCDCLATRMKKVNNQLEIALQRETLIREYSVALTKLLQKASQTHHNLPFNDLWLALNALWSSCQMRITMLEREALGLKKFWPDSYPDQKAHCSQ